MDNCISCVGELLTGMEGLSTVSGTFAEGITVCIPFPCSNRAGTDGMLIITFQTTHILKNSLLYSVHFITIEWIVT